MKKENIYDILIVPIHTEKATISAEASKYMFRVHRKATKLHIKAAVEEVFAVKVRKVNVLNTSVKPKIFKGVKGVRPSFKKATVTLEQGSIIDLVKV